MEHFEEALMGSALSNNRVIINTVILLYSYRIIIKGTILSVSPLIDCYSKINYKSLSDVFIGLAYEVIFNFHRLNRIRHTMLQLEFEERYLCNSSLPPLKLM